MRRVTDDTYVPSLQDSDFSRSSQAVLPQLEMEKAFVR